MKVYQRDFSFYTTHGGSGGKYHAMGNDLASKCGRVRMLNEEAGRDIEMVADILLCRACFPPHPIAACQEGGVR